MLIGHDRADDDTECEEAHSHTLSRIVLDQLRQAFASAPVANPDGISGIHLINDVGEGGSFTGGNVIDLPDGERHGSVSGSDVATRKSPHLASDRVGFFHHIIHVHRHSDNPFSSGRAEIIGDDLIVSLQCAFLKNVRNTIQHELGHNLGLLHG